MLAAAREALDGVTNPPELLAVVTVLTSIYAACALKASGHPPRPPHPRSTPGRASSVSRDCKFRGFVCSPRERVSAALRACKPVPKGVIVVPGIRPAGASSGDQKRIAASADAIRNGASSIVVGWLPHHAGSQPSPGSPGNPRRNGRSDSVMSSH